MATWKKVIVSGSNAILNQVTASGGFSGDGSGLTGISADNLGNSLVDGNGIAEFTFDGSAGKTVTVELDGGTLAVGGSGVKIATGGVTATQIATSVAGAGLAGGGGTALSVGVDDSSIEINSDALRVKASGITNTMLGGSIANAKLANDGITIAGVDTSLGGTITAATIGDAIGAFSGSSQVTGITVGQMAANSVDSDQYVNGSVDNVHLANDGITIAGVDTSLGGTITQATILAGSTVVSGSVNTQVAMGGDISGNANNATVTKVQGVALTSGEATQLATINSVTITNDQWGYLGASNQSIASGASPTFSTANFTDATDKRLLTNAQETLVDNAIQPNDDATLSSLTVSGDLAVNGDLVTVNTANLNVEDQFILINSGSSTATNESGIIFGGSNGAVGAGAALVWNGDYNGSDGRLAVANAVDWNDTSATVSYYVGGVFLGNEADAATAQSDHPGNIRVESNDIYIYA